MQIKLFLKPSYPVRFFYIRSVSLPRQTEFSINEFSRNLKYLFQYMLIISQFPDFSSEMGRKKQAPSCLLFGG